MPVLSGTLGAIYGFSEKEESLKEIEAKLRKRKDKKVKQKFFYQWMIRFEQIEQIGIIED
jgi:hypothetical protein